MLNRGYAFTTIIGPKDHGQSLLAHLASLYPHSTLQAWQQNLKPRRSHPQRHPRHRSRTHRLRPDPHLAPPPWHEPDAPEHFQILFDDPHLLAVNKPGGLPTLPGAGFLEHTLLRLVQRQFPTANPVHRLGRATTGIVLFAKTPQAAARLTADWNTPNIQKIYRALAQGNAQQDTYEILTPIGLVPHPLIGSVWAASPAGKASKSVATVVARTAATTLASATTTFAVALHSGRPHQIRNPPRLHRPPARRRPPLRPHRPTPQRPSRPPGDGGYLLHAHHLHFPHPITGEPIHLEAPPPPGL